MKFKGSGRFQNVTLLGRRSRLKHVYLDTSSSRSDDVEWFTGNDELRALRSTQSKKDLTEKERTYNICKQLSLFMRINQIKSNGISHHYQLDESIWNIRVVVG